MIQATWSVDVAKGIVTGTLAQATDAQLEAVLDVEAWGPVCDALPAGLDVLVANGRMMTGAYPRLLQECLGFTGDDVDGSIGPDTLGDAAECDARTLINALHGRHYAYLRELSTWGEFGNGWTRRLVAAHVAARALAEPL